MKNQRGFTLIELILVIVILGIIAGAFAVGLVPAMRAFLVVDTRKEALQSARMAMDRMVREIRLIRTATATSCPSPSCDVEICTVTNLRFRDAFNNLIEFNRTGGGPPYTLLRNTDNLSGNVQSLTFTYLDKGGSTLTPGNPCPQASAEAIWRIQIDLQVKVGDETVQLRTQLNPANFQ